MNLSEAIIALTTIAVDQRKLIQALSDALREVTGILKGVAETGHEHERRLIALEAASTITLPPDLVAAIGQAQQPTEGEGGTVTPPAIL